MLRWDEKLRILADYFNVGESEMLHKCVEFRFGCLSITDEFEEFVRKSEYEKH